MTSGLGMTSDDWMKLYNQQVSAARSTMARSTSSSTSTALTSSSQDTSSVFTVSDKGNTCTDGVDDGDISFFSKAANVVEGFGKQGLNMLSSAIKHPFKTAALIGVCCIPVVGPVVGAGLAAYGLYNGVKTMADSVSAIAAGDFETDAQAKDAWESLGEGSFTTAASALALKGSAGALKNQLSGGSSTVNTYRDLKSNGASTSEIMGKVVEEGCKETANNAGSLVKSVKDKAVDKIDKGKAAYEHVKNNGVTQSIEDAGNAIAKKAGETASKVGNKIDEIAPSEQAIEAKVNQLKSQGEVTVNDQTGAFEVKDSNGCTRSYTAKGKEITTVKQKVANLELEAEANGATFEKTNGGYNVTKGDTVTKYSNRGTKLSETTTSKSGLVEKTEEIIFDKNGNAIKTTTTKNIRNGEKVETTLETAQNTTTKVQTEKSSTTTVDAKNGYSKTTAKTTGADGKTTTTTTYTNNGVKIEGSDATLGQKLENSLNTSSTSKVIDADINTPFGTLTNRKLYYILTPLDENQK